MKRFGRLLGLVGVAVWFALLGGVAGAASPTDLEMHHADFHARLGMKLYVQVGPAGGDALKATLTSDAGMNKVVAEKAKGPLTAEEIITLDLRGLPKGEYTLTVEVGAEGKPERRAMRTFRKPYDGVPRVGIDENNAVCVNGRPFFPVMCKGINSEGDVAKWAPYINTLKHVGFDEKVYTPEGFKSWLDLAARHKLMAVGPGRGYWWPNGGPIAKSTVNGKKQQDRKALMEKMVDYIKVARDHEAFLMYEWKDEPDLDNAENCILPAEVRRWTEQCHELDPQHLVYMNTSGGHFARPKGNWGYEHIKSYTFLYNGIPGPAKVLLADFISQDYYPIEDGDDRRYNVSIENMCLAMDRMREWNADLAPLCACVETCDITKPATPPPTAAEVRLLSWANVIHGARGISWFHYFKPTPPENFAEMKRFKEQVTRLAPAVLGPLYAGTVTTKAQGDGRIDVVARESGGAVYLFAANLKREPETASFTLDIAPKSVEVVDENRLLQPAGRTFADRFEPLAVHIYKVSK